MHPSIGRDVHRLTDRQGTLSFLLPPCQEELPVAERRFGILINSHDDGLDVLVAPAFARSQPPNLSQSLDSRRVVCPCRRTMR
jgi:hypothetical protein